MATSYSLDQLRADIEEKYGPFHVDLGAGQPPVVLLPLMRLPREKRAAFVELHKQMQDVQSAGDVDLDAVVAPILDIFRLVAESQAAAEALIAALPDEPAFALELFERWAAAAMPGEASPSEN